jgi:1-acyl-sn-glycerol-3-phosphate acyltransferase
VSAPVVGAPASGASAREWRLARFLRVTVAQLLKAVYRTRVIGAENVPAEGGFVLAGNHVSYLDPALLWCVAIRPTHFIAKQELFDKPLLRWVLTRVWSFPINRGTADREAIQRATDLLQHGEPVGIFPEGTRQLAGQSAELGEAHQGVSFIAMRAGAPVVPVGIAGTDKALPKGAKLPRFPRVTIAYGEPVYPEAFSEGGRKERTKAMTAEIMRRIEMARAAAEGA